MKTLSFLLIGPVFCLVLVTGLSCSSHSDSNAVANHEQPPPTSDEPKSENVQIETPPFDEAAKERIRNEKWTGDLQGMRERRVIRAIVLYDKTNFFYDGPQPRGITYDRLKSFETFLNKKLNTGDKPIYIAFIPVTRTEARKRMSEGRADLIASNIAITPEFQAAVDFSDPFRENAKEVVVTGPGAPPIATIDDLAGKEVFVRKLSRYWPNLERLNARFK